MKIILTLLLFFNSVTGLKAQKIMLADTNAVKSINGIVKEVLRLQSGESGKTKNWIA